MRTNPANFDIALAEKNYVQCNGGFVEKWNGSLADKLQNSPDFEITPHPFEVWEVTTDFHDWRTDCNKPVAILRAAQSSLAGALKYMGENRVLVWRKDVPEYD